MTKRTLSPRQAADLGEERPGGATTIYALHASERNWLDLRAPTVPLPAPVVATLAWDAFSQLVLHADCGIVLLPDCPAEMHWRNLRRLCASHPLVPLVVVSPVTVPPDIGRHAEVEAAPLVVGALWPAVQRARTRCMLREAAALLRVNEAIPWRLRGVLADVFAGTTDARTVAAVAAAADHHRRTVWRNWRSTGPVAELLHLGDLLDWSTLLHAYCLHIHGLSWNRVADGVAVHRKTLARIAESLAGLPLAELTADAGPRLRAIFRRTVIEALSAGRLSS